jgi:aspartate 1-decarboxylase
MMFVSLLKSKVHGARVTGCRTDYVGSITIDRALMDAAGLSEHERVLVADITNGARLETYVIPGGEGAIELNGAAARIVDVGDEVIIMSFALVEHGAAAGHKPSIVVVDGSNRPVK